MSSVAFDLVGAHRAILRSALRPLEKLVALALVDFYSRESPRPFPSVSTLETCTSLCRHAVVKALKGLRGAGAIRVIEGGRGLGNSYDLSPLMALPVRQLHQCTRRTSARAAPVHDTHSTSAPDAPPPVHQTHPKEPKKEPKKEPTPLALSSTPEQAPDPRVAHLWEHYHLEHTRLRGVKPVFTAQQRGAVGKAWKSILEVLSLDDAKAVVTRAIAKGFHVQPSMILKNLNSYRGEDPARPFQKGEKPPGLIEHERLEAERQRAERRKALEFSRS